MIKRLFRTKSIEQILADADHPDHRLKKTLTAWDLTARICSIDLVRKSRLITLSPQSGWMAKSSVGLMSFCFLWSQV